MDPAPTVLEPDPQEVTDAIASALDGPEEERERGLLRVAASWPVSSESWARLGDLAYLRGEDVVAYAFYRTGYHRGLDRLRAAGWRGAGPAPWEHASNRGFLRALYGLMRAAAALGEGVEARRCREFLLQLDPGDHFEVEQIRPAALSRRLSTDPPPSG